MPHASYGPTEKMSKIPNQVAYQKQNGSAAFRHVEGKVENADQKQHSNAAARHVDGNDIASSDIQRIYDSLRAEFAWDKETVEQRTKRIEARERAKAKWDALVRGIEKLNNERPL
ncbi:hypothetical protein AC578_1494 [Pseudocercospora eumusae]|uniref:Uncharacterized protein n=1 Tax=Pseudocercospora eumusae TaxID=321146 RepID=A0A139H5Q3_9PEZI|nr:hypothetical protein AC578_1494 [Pseudocercospora eumusae]